MNPHRAQKPVDEFDETPTRHPSQLPPKGDGKNPHVLIVGAGLGGLMLAILLDKAGIPYEIFERTREVRPLGSVIALHPNVLTVFEQLGLYEELLAIALPISPSESRLMYGDLSLIDKLPRFDVESIGYFTLMFSRPKLYELIMSRVPAEKIHFSKKVMSFQQNKEGVMIRCQDNTSYHGDVLVGADGAYSGVRQHLYRTLQDQKLLPISDAKDLNKGYLCLVGTSNPLDSTKHPDIVREDCIFTQVIGKGTSYTWSEFNMLEHRVCWVVTKQLTSLEESEELKFRNSEWGPEHNAAMINEVKDFKVPIAGTLGNLIDATPPELISRVFLEDKLFETWTHGRTVLIGDAAHKLLPSAGQGAVCAMLDAVILANCLYDLKNLKVETIQDALKDYKEQRFPYVQLQYKTSKINAIVLHGQTLTERLIRHIAFHWIPESIRRKEFTKSNAYRPQATFLPLAPRRGTSEVLPQKPSRRYEEEQRVKRASMLPQPASTPETPIAV